MSRWIAALVAACVLFSTTPVLAAVTGFVRGVVTESGAPTAGASVTLTGEGSRLTTTTNARGEYSFGYQPRHYQQFLRS